MQSYWHSRGYLPHFESPEAVQFVTYRLFDSLPAEAAKRLACERGPGPKPEAAYRRRIETYLDAGHGRCWLRRPQFAAAVRESFFRHDGRRHRLLAWVIMPNHVHVLFQAIAPWTLSEIVKCWKSFTARRINEGLERRGRLWQEEYWDRFIRNERHFAEVRAYIHDNPVRAGLVARAKDWPWSSCGNGAQ